MVTKTTHRCCFTGHRPEKLQLPECLLTDSLSKEIHLAIEDGFSVFISGMARGIDLIAAEILIHLRDTQKLPLKLIAASPYEGFEKQWSHHWQMRYQAVMKAADYKTFIRSEYHPNCFQLRNRWMVDHCSRVIAVYNGKPGGTKNTICYAKQQGVDIRVISLSP